MSDLSIAPPTITDPHTLSLALDAAASALAAYLEATIPPPQRARWRQVAAEAQQAAPVTFGRWLSLLVAGAAADRVPPHVVDQVRAAAAGLLAAAGAPVPVVAAPAPADAPVPPVVFLRNILAARLLAARLMAPARVDLHVVQGLLDRLSACGTAWAQLCTDDRHALYMACGNICCDLFERTERTERDDRKAEMYGEVLSALETLEEELRASIPAAAHEARHTGEQGPHRAPQSRAVRVLERILEGLE